MTRTQRFGKLFTFDHWAGSLAAESVSGVPEANRADPRFIRALEILAHNQVAKRVWLDRIQGVAGAEKTEWFPRWSVDECRQRERENDERWAAFLATLDEPGLDRDVTYKSSEGIGYTSTIEEILTHVVNHGTYHRGQIARLVSECAGKRAATDYIAFTRRAT